MRKFMKISLSVIVVLLLIVLSAVGYLYYRSNITQSGRLEFEQLHGKVTVVRDEHGVPHIRAYKDDRDAYFALGYVHAQERLWQMDFQRHIVQGRLSELFGDKTVDIDKFLRTLGPYRAALLDVTALDPNTRKVLDSYLAGVNAFIAEHRFPIEFTLVGHAPKPFTEADIIGWAKMMSYDLQYMWQYKIRNQELRQHHGLAFLKQFFPRYPEQAPHTLRWHATNDQQGTKTQLSQVQLPETTLTSLKQLLAMNTKLSGVAGQSANSVNGSNEWVVSGQLTQSGKPLLCNDPHLKLQAPMLWYLADVKGPTLHMIGATLPGVPSVVIGHNDHIAWGLTNVSANSQDLYALPNHANIKQRHEVIKVKGGQDVPITIEVSDIGPVISSVFEPLSHQSQKIAMRWVSLEPNDTTLNAFTALNTAKDWRQFQSAFQQFVGPTLNFVYADTKGNIGYHMVGHVPNRKGWKSDSIVPLDAKHQWHGYVPFNKMPHAYNPKQGWIANANNPVVQESKQYPIAFYWPVPPSRIETIVSLLKGRISQGKLTASDMRDIQDNIVSQYAKHLLPSLIKTPTDSKQEQAAIALLAGWDASMSIDSVPATIFNVWYSKLAQRLVNDRLQYPFKMRGVPLMIQQQLNHNGALCHINRHVQHCDQILVSTLHETINDLNHRFGTNMSTWQWGRLHQATFTYLGIGESKQIGWLFNRKIPTPGANFTVNMAGYEFDSYKNDYGPGYRQIIDLSNFDNSFYITSLGQSGSILSKHYADLMPIWRDGHYIPMSSNPKDWGKKQVLFLLPKREAVS